MRMLTIAKEVADVNTRMESRVHRKVQARFGEGDTPYPKGSTVPTLPRPWWATCRAVRSPPAMAERRPASGAAPPREATSSQTEQSLLVLGECAWFCFPAPQAPNAALHLHRGA